MIISIIAALADNLVIGKDNKMLWHLPADFKHLRILTMGKPIIMGRKTFESIGKPLAGRDNIVITANAEFHATGITIVNSLPEALSVVNNLTEVFIFGGAAVYAQALPLASRMYLTMVKHSFEGDTFFPQWSPQDWKITQREYHQRDAQNNYDYEFCWLKRNRNTE